MDIFTKWREGKKKHDERVEKDLEDKFYQILLPPPDINTASILIREISECRRRKEQDKETLLWKTLGDYALGMAGIQSKPIPKRTQFGGGNVMLCDNKKADCPHVKCECGVQPNGDIVHCNPNAAKAHMDAISKANRTQYGQTQVVNSPTNARVKRQDPLKEELRERRENGIDNDSAEKRAHWIKHTGDNF